MNNVVTLWLTGLPCSGKTSISKNILKTLSRPCFMLDGDVLRRGLCADLDFSETGRYENVRRVAHLSKVLMQQGIIPIVSILAPLTSHRKLAREIIGDAMKVVYLDADLSVCEKRDVKGMYHKARRGELQNFTGVDSPFDIPDHPDIILNTDRLTIDDCSKIIINKFINP